MEPPVFAKASFVLPGRIVGKNNAYRPPVDEDGNYKAYRVLTSAAREFKKRVATYAAAALALSADWPRDPWQATHVRITWRSYNDKHDVDAKVLIQDAMSGIFYEDDRYVTWGPTELPIKDSGGARTSVELELLALISPEEAATKRELSIRRSIARRERLARKAADDAKSGLPQVSKKRSGRNALPPEILVRLIPT